MKNDTFATYFSRLGTNWEVDDEMIDCMEEFVCSLYGKPSKDLNLLRYKLNCAKEGKVDPDDLPPCKSTLGAHVKRANYQAAIWRNATITLSYIPSPAEHGWIIDGEDLSIEWLRSKPAPDEILKLVFVNDLVRLSHVVVYKLD